jgi:opacity protein-like surface antigen
LSVPLSANIEPSNPASANIQASKPVAAHYLTLWAGTAAHHDTEIDVNNSRITFDTGLAGGAAVGYDFGAARLEVEGSYRHNNADEGDADLEVTTLMANVYADFETDGSATPYLGVGVGVADVDLEDEDDQVLAGQVAAGMLFAVTEKVAIDLGYRYMVADAPDIVGNDKELQQHTALIGVQIKF